MDVITACTALMLSAVLTLSAASGAIPVPEKEHPLADGAAAVVEEVIEARKLNEKQLAVGWKDLVSGEEYYYNADESFYGASMYKVALNMEYARRVAEGELTWDSPIRGSKLGILTTGSLEMSNNNYSYTLFQAMGGYRKFRISTAYLYGLTEEEAEADRKYIRDHWITPRRMITCLDTLYRDPDRYPTVLHHLFLAQPGRYFRLQEDRWPIAQKYGAEKVNATWLSTGGVIYVPGRPFLLVVMTRNAPRPEKIISELSVRLGDYALTLSGQDRRHGR